MTKEELNKREQKESQSEVIRAIGDAGLAIDRIRENFALIFGLREDRAHEWIDNYKAVQPSSLENYHEGEIEKLITRHRLKVKPLRLVEREVIQAAIEASGGSITSRSVARGGAFNGIPQASVLERCLVPSSSRLVAAPESIVYPVLNS